MSAARHLAIDIWSDVMCPWCLIGWGQLQQALKLLEGEITAGIRWRPFELNPDMGEDGEDRNMHLQRKYGRNAQEGAELGARMRTIAAEAGVSLDFAGEGEPPPAMMWNTFAAHCLLDWTFEAQGAESQTRLKLALFAAHFNQRRRLGEHAVLGDIAAGVGLDRGEALAVMDDRARAARVRAEQRKAWDQNITGVPAMVIEGKFLIPGAQGPETYANALRRVAAKLAA